MVVKISRKFNDQEYSMTIKRVADVKKALIEFCIDSAEDHSVFKECGDVIKKIRGYNEGFGSAENAREQFNKYLEVDSASSFSSGTVVYFKELIRVMAITNGLGHYF